MKLYELISFLPKTTTKSFDDRVNKKSNRLGNNSVLGRGHFGVVHSTDSPKRLNQVSKTGRAGRVGLARPKPVDTIERDGYLSYIRMVDAFEKEGGQNPYFPRIHKLKLYRTPDGNIEYDADIEKLYPLDSPKITSNESLMHSLYHDMFEVKNETEIPIDASTIISQIDNISRGHFGNVLRIKDDELRDALERISEVEQEGRFSMDLGSQNLMWRITGNRPQLVFTDPLA